MDCKSVSVMAGPLCFLMQTIFLSVVLSSNYLLYDFNATRFKKLKKNFLDIFLLLVPLESLIHYPDTNIFFWLGEDFSMDHG